MSASREHVPEASGGMDWLRALAEAAFDATLILDGERIVGANGRAAGLFDYATPEMLSGKTFMELATPEQRDHARALIEQNVAFSADLSFIRSDGSILNTDVRGRPYPYQGGRGIIVAIRPRIQSVEAEEALRASEERYRKLAGTAVDAIITTDEVGVILDWNRAAETIFGYSREEAIGLPVSVVMPERYVNRHVAGMERVRRTGETRVIGHTVEMHGLRKGGIEFPLELSLSWWFFGGENRYTGIIRDITERKIAEEALRASRELLSSVLSSSLDAISAFQAIRDGAGNISDFRWLLANPKALEFSGVEAESLEGCAILKDAPRSPDAKLVDVYKHVVETSQSFEDTLEYGMMGSNHWLQVTVVKLDDGCAATFRDVTERMQARRATEQANEALAKRNQDLQEFAYVASHDLQEPLRKIGSFADLLVLDYKDRLDETALQYLERMQNAASRMSRLITDLLTFSRVSTRGEAFERVDLAEVLRNVISDIDLLIQESGGEIKAHPLPTIRADRTQMYQLFQNLISNSLKFHAPDRRPVVQVRGFLQYNPTGSGTNESSVCRIEVEDNGIGFDEKYLERIFMPFQRLHSEAQYPGTGIGLAVCRRIADRHGGTIKAESVLGAGSTFIVTLPAE